MSQLCLTAIVIANILNVVLTKYDTNHDASVIRTKVLAIWPNATIPFYVNPLHFDHEQTLSILTALSMFAFKTCLKFKPVMASPESNEEVLTFINPDGVRRCNLETKGHSVFFPHFMILGYECLKSPDIDMMIMKALGFPFEHNRITRDLFIDVLQENIEPGAIELFTKEDTLPLELRFLPYDINSVMHFGNREYSKNGHRTIIFKDPEAQQTRDGLSKIDLKKIEIVYGPQCRIRDRQEKIQLCQSYPGVARKKREADDNNDNKIDDKEHSTTKNVERRKRQIDEKLLATKSLRVNPDITPPPEKTLEDVTKILSDLGIDQEVQEIVEHVYKVSARALKNAREKYCNNSNIKPEPSTDIKVTRNSTDVLGIIEVVAEYAKGIVELAVQNLTQFCEESESIDIYQRARGCNWASDPRCRQTYRSTKSGPVKASTQHRPVYKQSTKHYGRDWHGQYGRSGNDTEVLDANNTQAARRKREVETTQKPVESETSEPEKNVKVESNKADNADENKAEVKEKQVAVLEENKEVAKVEIEKKEDVQKERAEENKEEANAQNNKNSSDVPILRRGTRLPAIKRVRYEQERRSMPVKRHRAKHISEYEDDEHSTETEKPRKKKFEKEDRKHPKISDEEVSDGSEKKRYKNSVRGKKKHKTGVRGHKEKYLAKKKDSAAEEDETESKEEGYKKKQAAKNIEVPKDSGESENDEDERPENDKQGERSGLPRTVTLSKKNVEFYKERLWPNGVVPFLIQEDTTYDLMDMRNRLEEVNYILKKKTCVQLKEISPVEASKYDDYLVIDNSPDYVTGRVGGRQKFGAIELYRGGQHRQHAAMLVMAMLGFYFEVSRHDRDKYVRMHMRHIRPDKLHHFEMIRSDATLPLPYDYASATHPAWQFWRHIGRTGISTVATYKEQDPDGSVMKNLGQHSQLLSDIDIVKINSVYGTECFNRARPDDEKLSANGTEPEKTA